MRVGQAMPWVLSGLLLAGCSASHKEPAPTTRHIVVADQRVDCVGVAPQCLRIRNADAEEWTLFRGEIEGFDHEPGHEYELLVAVETVENPPADASSERWRLVELVSKTPTATGDARPGATAEQLAGRSWMLSLFGKTGETPPEPKQISLTMDPLGKLTGSGGCNRYHSGYELKPDGSISFGSVISTRMACPEPIMGAEIAYFQALGQVRRAVVTGNRLLLLDESGTPLLEFDAE